MDHVPTFAEQVGQRIRLARERCDINQSGLAVLIGLQQGTVCRIESGEIAVSAERLLEIAAALQVSVVELLPVAQEAKKIGDDCRQVAGA